MKHKHCTTVVFQWTTQHQLDLVIEELSQRFHEVTILWNRAQEQADCTDQIDNDLDGLYAALDNVLADLDVQGHEREEFPR